MHQTTLRDVEDASVVEHGQPVLDADRSCEHALDAGRAQVLPPVAEQRRAAVPDVRAHLAAERRVDGQDVRADEEEPAEEEPPAAALDRRRHLPGVPPREDDLVLRDAASKAMSEPEWLAPTTRTRPVLELRQVPVRRSSGAA